VANISFLVLYSFMHSRIAGVYGRRLRSVVWKVSVASLAMALAVWALSQGFHAIFHRVGVARLFDIGVAIPAGAAVVFALCRLLRVEELEMATRALGGPILHRFPALAAKLGV
jgi:putative peptidoglycan lipid II flippase